MLWLPRQIPELIEAVYGDQPLPLDARPSALLDDARAEMEQEIAASAINAKRRIVLPPQRDDFLTRKIEALEEEDPAVHSDFQALTREAPPGVSLVCLHRLPDGQTALQPGDTSTQIDLDRPPTHKQVTQLLGASLQVQRPEVVRYFAGQPHFAPWKDIPALRYHHPVVFQNGQAPLPGLAFAIRLDPELGLSFQKEDA